MRGPALLPLLACLLPLCGCASRYVATDRGPQAYYQTGHPIRDTSTDLARLFRAVKLLQVSGSYHTYRFELRDSIRLEDTRRRSTYQRASEDYTFDHHKTGTATVVSMSGSRALLMTNAHVTTLPDTVVVYYREQAAGGPMRVVTEYVESVSIRTMARYLLLGLPEVRPFTILATDDINDVAAISADLRGEEDAVRPLSIRAGDPAKLSWGSFVYVLGYPRGFPMVTRAIVSDPDRSTDHSFLLDGLFNRGISGGLVVAIRGDTNELEWVGLATSASADVDYRLVPERPAIDEDNIQVPYEGRLYLERSTRIDYGITFSVPSPAVLRLLRQARVPVLVSEATTR